MKYKKSLGQNFFVNKNLSKQISETILKEEPHRIIEIGPGTGVFTQYFYKKGVDLILIEKDNLLAEKLTELFPNAKIINRDFLELNLNSLGLKSHEKDVFFGSLPYNVSKLIIWEIISSPHFKNKAYFIIQKEVAEKYNSNVPSNNLLSLKTQLYAQVKILNNISPDSFRPKPKVNSSLVSFSPLDRDISSLDIDSFLEFLHICFTQPRKTLHNNLKKHLQNYNKENDSHLNLLLAKRPQHLTLDEYLSLYENSSFLLI